MKVVIRTDASLQIGTGHVMRCLTLAEALTKKGAEVEFICREHKGSLVEQIRRHGFKCHLLNSLPSVHKTRLNGQQAERLYHASWLGATQFQDAEQCRPILECVMPDWLIVDHYAIDEKWQLVLRDTYKKLMVIDDLADRKHQCDILLDQTFERSIDDYAALTPPESQLLLGPKFVLLRAEFIQYREYSLLRRATNTGLRKLLISMGGVDPKNITSLILEKLKSCDFSEEIEIMVILGKTSPHIKPVKTLLETIPYKTTTKVGVENMAEIMANSDLAIGAAGSTTWERCCLGLPSIQIAFAENQKLIAKNLQKKNIVRTLKSIDELCSELNSMKRKLPFYSKKSSSIVQGAGTDLVVKAIYE